MDFRKEKIRVMTEKLNDLIVFERESVKYSYIKVSEYKRDNVPPMLNDQWALYEPKLLFDGIDAHYWLYMRITAGEYRDGKERRLCVKTGREEQWDATNPQFTVYINGVTRQALDVNHTWLPLECENDLDIYMYLYSGMQGGNFEVNISIDTVDLMIESLYYDIHVPYQVLCELPEESYDYILIRDCVDKALVNLDLRHVYSEDFYRSIKATSEYMKKEFYDKLCGNSKGVVSCIGHTHIDIAWLWTVAQTREKAQRSFATVLSLINRYGDYIFMSSQPQLFQFVKETDPELYDRIKRAVQDGRWEIEGAMWLEADTNLIAGESLIRQIMYGKKFIKNEFNIDSSILWLPDVFGYTGALPQILKKCGVTRFFTAKMCWNESNKMPNDSFIWEGIDGSRVFANIVEGYVHQLNAGEVKAAWEGYKNKSYSNHVLLTCGFGDGGGGTTYEMMENYKRLKFGLPGMPGVIMEKAGTFFDRIEKDFSKNAEELEKKPVWKGEMYFEMHRGTYTSIARNKKYNRKSEFLYQKAEELSVLDLCMNGGEYPVHVLQKNMLNILLNQFHDIIPGSSIKEVYDVTDREYRNILREGQELVNDKLAAVKNQLNTEGGIFIYNPTSFTTSEYITLNDKTYFAESIPAHGWRVIPAIPCETGIIVTDRSIENDCIKVIFNRKYHIISLYDKREKREVIPTGCEAGYLEVYEDYPRQFDAWEITEYYQQKRWIADHIDKVELLKNGIRIRIKYQKSVITQDIVLTRNSSRIDFKTKVDWHEDHVLLKAAFPVDINAVNAIYDIQFGYLERPTHRNNSWDAARFEVCAHKWADLSEANYGVSILNDCKYGYSIEDNVMKITLLKAPTYPNPEADRGIHQFTYSLYVHSGDFRSGKTIREGYLLNAPLDISVIGRRTGKWPERFSLINCPQENIVIETIKKAEDDDAIIVRLYDSFNQKTEAKIYAFFEIKEVYLCDILENELEKLKNDGRIVTVFVRNFEIVTLKFTR